MKTGTTRMAALVVMILVGATAAAAQNFRYAVESGGLETGTCPVAAPCTFARAVTQAASSGDIVAVRVRRAGDTAVLGSVSLPARYLKFAVYNEIENPDLPHLLEGDLELRGRVVSAGSVGYDGKLGKLIISGSQVDVSSGAFVGTGSFADWATNNTFRGNVVFTGTTTLSHVGNNAPCAVFQKLQVAATGKLTVEGGCANSVHTDYDALTGGTTATGITVWNVLNVAGQLELQDGLNLNILAPRPETKADSIYSAPHKLPGGSVSGSITGAGMVYLAMEAEQVATTDSIVYWGGGTSATAFDSGDTIRTFVASYTGWPNAPFAALASDKSKLKRIKSEKLTLKYLPGARYVLGGSGSIYMDLTKTTQAGAEISPSFGNGGISTNDAGVLIVKSRTVRGHFVNDGRAQTEFTSSVTIDRDVIVESYTANASAVATRGGIGGPKASVAQAGSPMRECYGESGLRADFDKKDFYIHAVGADTLSTTRGLTTGIYFRGYRATIGGALEVRNGFMTDDGCYGGAYVMGSTNVAYDVIGLDVGTGAAASDYAHFMIEGNFTIEGDLDLDGVSNVVTRRKPATKPGATGRTAGNICIGAKPKATGTHVVFTGGQALQMVSLAADLDMTGIGIKVDKSTAQEVEFIGGNVKTQSVDIQGGFLTTNGRLDVAGGHLLISQNQGAVGDIRRGTGDTAYLITKDKDDKDVVHLPETITYTGSLASMDTGDELYDGMSVKNMEMYLGTASTKLTVLTNVKVSTSLALSQGTLELPTGIKLESPNTLNVGKAYVIESGGGWTTAKAGTITFVGQTSRTTDNIVPSHNSLKAAKKGKLATVVVDGCAGSKVKPITLSLQKGYTSFAGGLTINRKNVVDMAGNHLVAKGTVHVTMDAWLCNSDAKVGVKCSASGTQRDDLDVLANALVAMHYDNTPDNRAAFAQARAAYAPPSGSVAKTAAGHGSVYTEGAVSLKLDSYKDRLEWHMPSFVVGESSTLSLEGGGVASTTTPPVMPSMADEVTFASLSLTDGGNKTPLGGITSGGSFIGKSGFDRYTVMGDLDVAKMSTVSISSAGSGNHPQAMLMVGGDMTVGLKAVVDIDDNYLGVAGDYEQGTAAGNASTVYVADGAHYQMGAFYVGPDTTETATKMTSPSNFYFLRATASAGDHGTTCNMSTTAQGGYTVSSGLMVYSDYSFMGSGDAFDTDRVPKAQLGLRGTVTFAGNDSAMVMMGGNARASFCDVVVESDQKGSTGMVTLGSDVMQNMYGTLTLRRGIVGAYGKDFKWALFNEAIEDTLVGRLSIRAEDEGVVKLGSRDSYIGGAVSRAVSIGTQGGGVVSGGYLFPVGSMDENMVRSYRPLILQFPADLGSTKWASVSYAAGLTPDSLSWPEDNLVVDGSDGGMLTLDNFAAMFWKVEMDAVPAHDPNIRLAADGLPNIFNIKGLRIVQWDCDGTNPRLAGVYDVYGAPLDDNSFMINDFVNGIPNLTQEGVELGACNLFGIASNTLENPISADPITSGTARVQFIHNLAGVAVDIYIDDHRVVDDFTFQSARAFGVVGAGTRKIDFVHAMAPDNSVDAITRMVHFRQNQKYHVIAHGNVAAGVVDIVVQEGVRTASAASDLVEFYFVHGASGLGTVDIRLIDPIDNTRVMDLLENNFSFGDVGPYLALDPGAYNMEVTTANNDTRIDVYRMEIYEHANRAFVFNLSGPGSSSADGVTIMGVGEDGNPFFPQVVTSLNANELPAEFALLGNYPNPFNPSTRIEFDLPETAQVSITVFDMLGRTVMALPAKEVEAGASRSIELIASRLASGNYFYRIVALTASGQHIDTGRMLLIK